MAKLSADLYDENYYRHYCGEVPYERTPGWLSFFGGVADRIIGDIAPKTVLDAGCALGLLVESLRDRNVEAFGIDISEYAIRNVRPDIAPYCWNGSITDPLPRRYDLIVTIEVLEHLPRPSAEAAVANLCRFTDDILFSSSPVDYRETTHFNVQPPEYWAELFLRQGFVRDVDCDASFITSWAVRFRRESVTMQRLVHDYERRFWPVWKENADLRSLVNEVRGQLNAAERENDALKKQASETQVELQKTVQRLAEIENSLSWRMVKAVVPPLQRALPKESVGGRLLSSTFNRGGQGLARARQVAADLRAVDPSRFLGKLSRPVTQRRFEVPPLTLPSALAAHRASVDVIVCVHNALDDVTRCLTSLVRYTRTPYRLILVDDGSEQPTCAYLARFAEEQGATLLRNERALGYTRAANQGLRASSGDYALLLNSDTIVTPDWLDRMVDCGESDARIGLVGPLSNTASWQSVPEVRVDEDWAANALPDGWEPADFARALAARSPRQHPRVGFLNGFCLMVKRALLTEIGLFDEQSFGRGYGEENDYCVRARAAGWQLAVADDAYVFHAQSRSYTNAGRRERIEAADRTLVEKHGRGPIDSGLLMTRDNRLLGGLRARTRVLHERERLIADGRQRWEGKRVLFLLPVADPGGGGHVALQEARAMRAMGVDARVLNLDEMRVAYEQHYADTGVPVQYVAGKERASSALRDVDAVIATANTSIEWMTLPGGAERSSLVRAYYIQDFEPFFYSPGSDGYWTAWKSYTRFPDLLRLTKTEWNRATVQTHLGVDSTIVGPSVDIDLFRPRPRRDGDWPARPLRVAAMIRPQTPRRQAKQTMEVLASFARAHADVEIVLFGVDNDDPLFTALPSDFAWRNAGVLRRQQLAALMNEIDLFADFSSFQAMGLAALEAMSCGAAVIVPRNGGATSFAEHEVNSLVIDTAKPEACLAALERLTADSALIARLSARAVADACRYHPEGVAHRILETLFGTAPAR
ncbi:MAG TPA: glycosyltransferase [Polyangia bacterium]|nr:glycosyltransferase [Polyangia bacterium]